MALDHWKKLRRLERDLDQDRFSYLSEKIDSNPTEVSELIELDDDPVDLEARLYLQEFIERFSGRHEDEDKKPFYRTLERVNRGNLSETRSAKAISSIFTKLLIEQENNQVPQSAFEKVLEWLERALEKGEISEVAVEVCDLLPSE